MQNCVTSLGFCAVLALHVTVVHATCTRKVPAPGEVLTSQLEYADGEPGRFVAYDDGKPITVSYIKVGHAAIVEGDILIGDADLLPQAAVIENDLLLPADAIRKFDLKAQPFGNVLISVLKGPEKWPSGIIAYRIDKALPAQQSTNIRQALTAWANATRVKFVEQTAETSFVHFLPGTDQSVCLSDHIGMRGGRQFVELAPGCSPGDIMHEIGHVIGLGHEQNRQDRNLFVQINFSNVKSGFEDQFEQYKSEYMDNGAYDFDSIMHYQPDAFACDLAVPTIVPKVVLPPGIRIGQRDHLSKGDVAAVAALYH
jgi:Astacin (Peptidase family M12A)